MSLTVDHCSELLLVHETAGADGIVKILARLALVAQSSLAFQVIRADVLLTHLVEHLVVEDTFLLLPNHSVLEV